MGDANLYISNGTCFYGEGQVSDSRYIPCGNSAVAGTQACCFQGDFCLAESVCYDNSTSVTYITGCTDATYSSSKCPHKPGYLDQLWVALARCDGDNIALFSGCSHHGDEVVIQHEDCTCDAAAALISNPVPGPTLHQIALLPPTAGGTISFNPTALPTATLSSHSTPEGLSAGGKAGIGVGVGVGVPVIAAIVFMFFYLRRRKRRIQEGELPPQQPPQVHPVQVQSPPPMYDPVSPGWHKPELPADSAHKVELPAVQYDSVASGSPKSPYGDHAHPEINGASFAVEGGQRVNGAHSLAIVSTTDSENPPAGLGHIQTMSSNVDPISERRSDSGRDP
ncbi:hypothetical protein GGS21DRAFT_214136 [Xylaria nigripes]|nr:hypothetical protein GGS21DRAFT_214136 [Xylaria nigripes]